MDKISLTPGTEINVNTEFNSTSGSFIFNTYYDDLILAVELMSESATISGIDFKEGELKLIDNESITAYIDNEGGFVVDGLESDNYSINTNGELIYTE